MIKYVCKYVSQCLAFSNLLFIIRESVMVPRGIEQGLKGSVCTKTNFFWEVLLGMKKA